MYWAAASMGMQAGSGIGSLIGGFFQAKASKAVGEAQARVARLQASVKATNLQWQAQQIAHAAGQQEYALYKQQQARAAKMEVSSANRGAMQEGTIIDRQVMQAEADSKNRDYLVQQGKDKQYQYVFGAQQALLEGENNAAYYTAMGKAGAASAIAGGIQSSLSAGQSLMNMGAYNYGKYGSFWGAGTSEGSK